MTSWKNNNLLYSMREAGERKIVARDKDHLRELIKTRISTEGPNCDLNDIDVSHVTDMSYLFYAAAEDFNGDISNWDVSNVTDMGWMFQRSKFSGDISGWDVSGAVYMKNMFLKSPLEGKEPNWYKNA